MEPTTPSSFPGTSQPQPQGWWSRNWKWFVPTGCLALIALGIGFILVITVFVFSLMKSTDVYKTAVASAKGNAIVIEALGSPLEEGWFLSGKTNVEGPSGEANIAIPISGPKGKGTIYAVATKSAGRWNYTTLEVEVDGRAERIPLQSDALEVE
jgi:hypothetical protein